MGNVNTDVFETKPQPLSEVAGAALVYSLVPFLGIIFIPVAVVVSVAEIFSATHDNKRAVKSLVLGSIVLAAQLVLWWLLYYVPTLHRQF
jgi:hypothetical protein